MVAANDGLASESKLSTETVLAMAFSTHACAGAPAALETSAKPRGTAPTATRPSTAPVSPFTVKTLSEPAAVTTSVLLFSLNWIPNGVASAIPAAGCSGGSGSKSKKLAVPQRDEQSIRVIWFRNARFSISAKPWPRVPALPLAVLRASVWAMNTWPLLPTTRP